MNKNRICIVVAGIIGSLILSACIDQNPENTHNTAHNLKLTVTESDYARADQFLAWRKDNFILNDRVRPNWIREGDDFWYKRIVGTGSKEFIRVIAASGEKRPAFNHQAIANEIKRLTDKEVSPKSLPFDQFTYNNDNGIDFTAYGKNFSCSTTDKCVRRDRTTTEGKKSGETVSPNGKWALSVKDDNLFVRSLETDETFALTDDGEKDYAYASSIGSDTSTITRKRFNGPDAPYVVFSPDGNMVVTQKIDQRAVGVHYLLQYAPENGSFRPKLHSYRYDLALDEQRPMASFVVFDLKSRSRIDVDYPAISLSFTTHVDPEGPEVYWREDGGGFYFVHREGFGKGFTINYVDAKTGTVKPFVKRTGDKHIFPGYRMIKPGVVHPVGSDKVVWWSDETGWGHLYLSSSDGDRRQLTDGKWVVINVVRVDEEEGTVYFLRHLSEDEGNPYHIALSSVSLDGNNFRTLTELAGHRSITSNHFSPSGRVFVDSVSNSKTPGLSTLRTKDGELAAELEQANASKLDDLGLAPSETFTVTAADSETKLWGRLFKPTNFDATKSYPIIDSIYPGPQQTWASHRFAGVYELPYILANSAQALAELGFIVIMVDGRGTPGRSRSFNYDTDKNLLADAGLVDHVAAIKELAAQRPYMNIDRVGIYGISAGGYASTRALLVHPDFYKVAVSFNGNHDQRTYHSRWGESYIGEASVDPTKTDQDNRIFGRFKDGVPSGHTPFANPGFQNISFASNTYHKVARIDRRDEVKVDQATKDLFKLASNVELAENLVGKLLLIVGDMDDNVHPASTYQLVNALIRSNKDFDLLSIPNGNHTLVSASPLDRAYAERRMWDYFVEHLMGAEPPKEYSITLPNGEISLYTQILKFKASRK
ncbi:MAG: prolyl oligopeptidase family serine peptidase [Pseudomonadota bacterium]